MDDQRKARRDKLLTDLLRIGKREPEISRRLAASEQKSERPAPQPGQASRPRED